MEFMEYCTEREKQNGVRVQMVVSVSVGCSPP